MINYRSCMRQRGVALVIGLIMLVLMTILAISAFNLGSSQVVAVANSQYKVEAMAAAQTAIEAVINTNNFSTNPAAAITGGCGTNKWCVDTNGDGVTDVTVNLTPQPTCISAAAIPISQLDISSAADLACTAGAAQTFGSSGSSSGDSLCANSTWEIDAKATDTVTNTTAEIIQGVTVRIATTDMTTNCP